MNILIAVPHIGNIRAELVQFLLSINSKHNVKIFLSWGKPITKNRNIILDIFNKGNFDYLLMIDSDIMPPSNILDMLENKVDICSADIHINNGSEIIKLALEKVEGGYRTKQTLIEGLNEVDAIGTGCILLSKKIIKEVGKFEGDNEDFNYCERAKEKGYKIYYDTRYKCKHFQIYPI